MKQSDKIFIVFIGLLIASAIYIALFPTISDLYYKIQQSNTILSYSNETKQLTEEQINKMFDDIYNYNQDLYKYWKGNTFSYQGSSKTDESYESILNTNNRIIGYIEIPKIKVYLPIVHGTKSEDLDSMVGHMYLSSFPGTINSHAILTAHTGLASAKLFTDIDKLSSGDEFYIYILNRKYTYVVNKTNICLPEDDYHYIQIEPNKDLVSLYTCTPYGINSHRLIITGEHDTTKDEKVNILAGPQSLSLEDNRTLNIIIFILTTVSPFLVILTTIIVYIKTKSKIIRKKAMEKDINV